MKPLSNLKIVPISILAVLMSSSCTHNNQATLNSDTVTSIIDHNHIIEYTFNKNQNSQYDLATAGLSIEQLRSPSPPKFKKPDAPTPLELRQQAYYHNIRALVDLSPEGGFKHNLQPIYGSEHLTYSVNNEGQTIASFLVQIPENFDPEKPCLISSASSGSRGIYGAVGVSGFWALSKGCAVTYTDKGTGTGFYFLDSRQGYTIDGQLSGKSNTKGQLLFEPGETKHNSKQKIVATKHAHSKTNIEKDWGQHVIDATYLGLHFLNKKFPDKQFTSENTTVIATGISNAGGAVLRAIENNGNNLFDAAVVGEPNINPDYAEFSIADTLGEFKNHSKTMIDYNSQVGLYQGCALLSEKYSNHSFGLYIQYNKETLKNQCGFLKESKLLTANTLEEQSTEAYQALRELGLLPQALQFLPIGSSISLWNSINATYMNAYAKTSVNTPVCQSYFVEDQKLLNKTTLFATSNGIPATKGIALDYQTPAIAEGISKNYQSDVCFAKTLKPELPIAIEIPHHALTIQNSLKQIKGNGNLNSTPTIIVHGRADGLIHVNHSSRAYLGLNYQQEGSQSKLKYYEIDNAQHFDAFNALPQLQTSYIPLHHYYEQSLDLMWAHLIQDAPLPPSQLVSTRTRKLINGTVEPLSDKHLPQISAEPSNKIKVNEDKVAIP